MYVKIDDKSPLNRFFIQTQRGNIAGFEFRSLEHAYWACYLVQHEAADLLPALCSQTSSVRKPENVKQWCRDRMKERNIETSTRWILQATEVWYAIAQCFVSAGFREICAEFKRVEKEAINSGANDKVYFLAVGRSKERILNSGFRPNISLQGDLSHKPGRNLYGFVWTLLYKNWKTGIFRQTVSFQDLLNRVVVPREPFYKMAIMASDQTFQHFSGVQNGDVIVEPQATWADLANALEVKSINLTNYHFVILSCGGYDAKLFRGEDKVAKWGKSWKKMRSLLMPLRDSGETMVVINSPIGFSTWFSLYEYVDWFMQEFNTEFSCENFRICDWTNPTPNNFFLKPNGGANMRYVTDNKRYPNQNGSRRLAKYWGENVYAQMLPVDFQVADNS